MHLPSLTIQLVQAIYKKLKETIEKVFADGKEKMLCVIQITETYPKLRIGVVLKLLPWISTNMQNTNWAGKNSSDYTIFHFFFTNISKFCYIIKYYSIFLIELGSFIQPESCIILYTYLFGWSFLLMTWQSWVLVL